MVCRITLPYHFLSAALYFTVASHQISDQQQIDALSLLERSAVFHCCVSPDLRSAADMSRKRKQEAPVQMEHTPSQPFTDIDTITSAMQALKLADNSE
jgi:hypothetical protein